MSKTFKTPKGTELPLLNLKGKDYLQVMHRLVWFREEHPLWSVETSFETLTDKYAVAKAIVRDEMGRLLSTAHKSETTQGFADFLEKAETGAIGRALALCGYGTQFCADELDEGDRLADSPAPARAALRPVVSPIRPEQPGPQDGELTPLGYRVPFGKFKAYSLDQLLHDPAIGPKGIADYIRFLEGPIQVKTRREKYPNLISDVNEFIERASDAIAALEQKWAEDAGAPPQ